MRKSSRPWWSVRFSLLWIFATCIVWSFADLRHPIPLHIPYRTSSLCLDSSFWIVVISGSGYQNLISLDFIPIIFYYGSFFVVLFWIGRAVFRAGLDSQREQNIERGVCVECGYDLRATPDRCPECGRVVDKVGDGTPELDARDEGAMSHIIGARSSQRWR